MELRHLGGTDLMTSPIGLNCLSFTRGCAVVDRAEAAAIVAQSMDTGVPLVDATDITAGRVVEALVGRAVRGRRDEVVLASRGGARFTPRGELISVDGRPRALALACEKTLRRLGTDHLDLYFLARVDPRVPVEESVGALGELVAVGKVRHIGLSDVTPDELRRAHAVHPVATVAAEYSLLERWVEAELLPVARSLGVGLAAYRPLGGGLLTGWLTSTDELPEDDYRRADPRFFPANFARNRDLARAAETLAARLDLSTGRLALAWLLAQGGDIVPVPGTRNLTHLEMNLAAAAVRLTDEDRVQLAALVSYERVVGGRGNPNS